MSLDKKEMKAVKIMVAIASPILLLYFCTQIGKPDPEIARLGEQSDCRADQFAGKPIDDRCKEILARSDAEARSMEEDECQSAREWGRSVSDRCKEIYFKKFGEYR